MAADMVDDANGENFLHGTQITHGKAEVVVQHHADMHFDGMLGPGGYFGKYGVVGDPDVDDQVIEEKHKRPRGPLEVEYGGSHSSRKFRAMEPICSKKDGHVVKDRRRLRLRFGIRRCRIKKISKMK